MTSISSIRLFSLWHSKRKYQFKIILKYYHKRKFLKNVGQPFYKQIYVAQIIRHLDLNKKLIINLEKKMTMMMRGKYIIFFFFVKKMVMMGKKYEFEENKLMMMRERTINIWSLKITKKEEKTKLTNLSRWQQSQNWTHTHANNTKRNPRTLFSLKRPSSWALPYSCSIILLKFIYLFIFW